MESSHVLLSTYTIETFAHAPQLIKEITDSHAHILFLSHDQNDLNGIRERLSGLGVQKKNFTVIPTAHESIWIRDYSGLVSVDHSNSGIKQIKMIDMIYDGVNNLNDTVPYQIGMNIFSSVSHFPLKMDGGNIVVTKNHCFQLQMVS